MHLRRLYYSILKNLTQPLIAYLTRIKTCNDIIASPVTVFTCIPVALIYKLLKKDLHTNCFYQERFAIRSQVGASKSKANDEARPLIGIVAVPKNERRPSLKFFWWKKRVILPPFNGFLNWWKQPSKITICSSIELTELIIIQPVRRLTRKH